jgi:hypothetical protein
MAGGGVGTGQDLSRIETSSIDVHLLVSSLQRSGISLVGAHQFSRADEVTNQSDRMALAGMLTNLLNRYVRR